jgi:hypothetical protein
MDCWEQRAETDQLMRTQLAPWLHPSEQIITVIRVARQRPFSSNVLALAVTNRRLMLLPLDRRLQPRTEPPISVFADQVVDASVRLGERDTWIFSSSTAEVRFEAAGESFRLTILGDHGDLGSLTSLLGVSG